MQACQEDFFKNVGRHTVPLCPGGSLRHHDDRASSRRARICRTPEQGTRGKPKSQWRNNIVFLQIHREANDKDRGKPSLRQSLLSGRHRPQVGCEPTNTQHMSLNQTAGV